MSRGQEIYEFYRFWRQFWWLQPLRQSALPMRPVSRQVRASRWHLLRAPVSGSLVRSKTERFVVMPGGVSAASASLSPVSGDARSAISALSSAVNTGLSRGVVAGPGAMIGATALKEEPGLDSLAWSAPAPVVKPASERRKEARLRGYEGEACPECANFTLVRNRISMPLLREHLKHLPDTVCVREMAFRAKHEHFRAPPSAISRCDRTHPRLLISPPHAAAASGIGISMNKARRSIFRHASRLNVSTSATSLASSMLRSAWHPKYHRTPSWITDWSKWRF